MSAGRTTLYPLPPLSAGEITMLLDGLGALIDTYPGDYEGDDATLLRRLRHHCRTRGIPVGG